MDRTTILNKEVLIKLGFQYDGQVWVHSTESNFAIKFEGAFFNISFHGYLSKYPYEPLVRTLEEQFYERTGNLLF